MPLRIKYKGILLRICCLLAGLFLTFSEARSGVVEDVNTLLEEYGKVSYKNKYKIGKQLYEIFHTNHVFMDSIAPLRPNMLEDSLNFMVWYGSERFYFEYAYYRESLQYANKALPMADVNDLLIYATLLADRGCSLYKLGIMSEAAESVEDAVRISQRIGDNFQLSRAYLYLAMVNYSLQQLDDARFFLHKALDATDDLDNPIDLQNVYAVASDLYIEAGKLRIAGLYAQKAIDMLYAAKRYKEIPRHLVNQSKVYLKMHRHEEAVQKADEALSMAQKYHSDNDMLADCMAQKAKCLMAFGRYADAAEVTEEAIRYNREVGNVRAVCQNYKTLYNSYIPIDSAKALDALEAYTAMFDSIHRDDINNRVSIVNTHLANDALLQQINLKSRANVMLIVATIILLFTVLGLVQAVFSNQKENKKQRDQILKLLLQLEKLHAAEPKSLPDTVSESGNKMERPREDDDWEPVKLEEADETEQQETGNVEDAVLNPYNSEFLSKVNDIILSQMRSGNIRIEHIASSLCLSPSQFRRKIQTITGLTPANYILTIRMDAAKNMLLQYPKFSVNEVALSCGFTDNPHFTHVFSRLFGMTPLQFANKSR